MTIEITQPKQNEVQTEWMPGFGDVAVYDGAFSTGPQYLELDPIAEEKYPTIGEASRAWASRNVAEELSPAEAMIAWAFAV